MPYGLPKSLLWFVVTGVVYLLQLFPYTGIFLMFVMAPYWSVILVNVGFVSLAIEALSRRGYLLWLVLPALYFGGYLGAVSVSQGEFARLDAEMRAFNAKAVAAAPAFDPASLDVVIDKDSYRAGGLASALATRYGLGAAYETNPNFKTASHQAYWLGKAPLCQEIRRNRTAGSASVNAYSLRSKDRRERSSLCRVSGPADPTKASIVVELAETKQKDWLLPTTLQTLTLRYPAGGTVTLKTGYAAPFSWLPLPVIGCWLNSGGPSWDCSAGFMRGRQKGLGSDGAYGSGNAAVIAGALRLEELTEAQMMARARTTLPNALTQSIGDRLSISTVNLERIIRNPAERFTAHDVKGLHQSPELWRDRVPDMLDALERAFDGGHKTRERATVLQDLLLKLDDAAYAPVNQRILAALLARPGLPQNFVRGATLNRLGALGAPAVPILERYIFQRVRPDVDAMLGLCRAGTSAAEPQNPPVQMG